MLDITVTQSTAERRSGTRALYQTSAAATIHLMLAYLALIAITFAGCVSETHVATGEDFLDIRLGGPVTRTALIAISLLIIIAGGTLWEARRSSMHRRKLISEPTFRCHLSDHGVTYGIPEVFTTFMAWENFHEVAIGPKWIELIRSRHGSQIDLNADAFTAEQKNELLDFLSLSRSLQRANKFFGVDLAYLNNKVVFGPIMPTDIKQK